MALITMFLLFAVLSVNEVRAQKNDSNIITLGSSLSPNTNSSSWVSPSRLFSFGFYPHDNGFAVGIWLMGEPEGTTVWTANFTNQSTSSDSVELTKDGQLVLRNEKQMKVVAVIANASEPADSASMLDSGNFVLYSKSHSVIWQSFDHPTDTIMGGQNLSQGQHLISANGHFILNMQTDGKLFTYPVSHERESDAYWDPNTSQLDGDSQLTLNLTGFLCLGSYGGNPIKVLAKSSNHLGRNRSLIIYRATLDLDGIFRLYVHTFEKNNNTGFTSQIIVWQAISDQCQVNGFCGLNSYCSNVSGKGECKCYPGFRPISGKENKNIFLVCEQIIKNDCITSGPGMLYNVSNPLQHIQWGLHPYLVIPLEMEACGNSCMEDCDCCAVLHGDGNCNKYKLPLMFGRINQNISTTALFKLPSANIIPTKPKKPEVLVDDKKNLILTLVITLGSISFVCLGFLVSIFIIYMRKVYSYKKLSANSENLGFAEDCSLRTFAFNELVDATANFTEETGRGSFGVVYKGTIRGNNKRIAVKKLNDDVVDEGEREFQAEITAIARTHHRNLVQLIGYCIDGSRKLLVYEYMSNGSLADFLFRPEMHLSWKQRVKIALDVARGVLYLHEECEVCIVHCNIKSRDILLDEMWTAKISDFGFARLSIREHSKAKSTNESSSGYVAPERQKDASTSIKVDIFSYGVVLLEIICCRRNINVKVASEEEIMLSSWVYNCFVRGELNKLVELDEDVEWRTLERMVKVALWCIQEDLSLRPSMKTVILMLEGLKDIPIPPSPIPLA
ncbi:hypothetical protein K1719_003192 [Acacia pycnantha]|nr:hypothetical protein K1719_003192 [Acacia pycnantha]